MGGALLPSRAGPDGWLAPVCGLRGLHCHAGTSCHACRARPISTWCTCVGGTATHSGWLLPDHCLCPLRAPHLPPPSGASWHVAAGSPPLPPPNFPSPPGAEHAGSGAGHPTPSPSLVLTPLGLTPPPPTPPIPTPCPVPTASLARLGLLSEVPVRSVSRKSQPAPDTYTTFPTRDSVFFWDIFVTALETSVSACLWGRAGVLGARPPDPQHPAQGSWAASAQLFTNPVNKRTARRIY